MYSFNICWLRRNTTQAAYQAWQPQPNTSGFCFIALFTSQSNINLIFNLPNIFVMYMCMCALGLAWFCQQICVWFDWFIENSVRISYPKPSYTSSIRLFCGSSSMVRSNVIVSLSVRKAVTVCVLVWSEPLILISIDMCVVIVMIYDWSWQEGSTTSSVPAQLLCKPAINTHTDCAAAS